MLEVNFYKTDRGNEPVRDWLKSLDAVDRKIIGTDIKTVQERYPLGMPLVRKMEKDISEVRSGISNGCIARVFFTVAEGEMVLLHGIVKKSTKTPVSALDTAKRRWKKWKGV